MRVKFCWWFSFFFAGGVVFVRAIGFVGWLVSHFTLVVILNFSLFSLTSLGRVWSSAECRFFSCSSNFGQSFSSCWINFSTRALYLLFSLQIFLFLFCRLRKILHKLGDFICSLKSRFFQAIFLHMVRVFFTTSSTCFVLYRLPWSIHIFTFEAPQRNQDVLCDPLYTIANLHLLGNEGLLECQDVDVGFDFFLLLF